MSTKPRPKSICGSPSREALSSLGGLSLNSPGKSRSARKSTKSLLSSQSRPGSPIRSYSSSSNGTKSAKTSPVKTPSHRKSKSIGNAQDGGLGRDIIVKDRDNSASPQKPGLQRKKSQKSMDRFIPNREATSASTGTLSVSQGPAADGATNGSGDEEHTENLTAALNLDLNKRILAFSAEPPPSSTEHSGLLAAMSKTPKRSASAPAQRRRIAAMPTRVLDAPGLIDDYYLNLLDWSVNNTVAIALEKQVYVWHADSGEVSKLCELGESDEVASDDCVCSVKFSDDGAYLAVGTADGPIQIFDVKGASKIRTMHGHISRVASLAWSGAVLSSGSRDGAIWNSDVRVAQHKQSEMRNHRAEVCGLAWRKDLSGGLTSGGQGLLASGGNDNVVNVWDGRNPSTPRMSKTNHTAAVKAIAWCPWQSSLLATGGGTNDKTIHFWNTTTSARLNSLTTNSQVTSIVFNPHAKELASSHGFPDNQISVWSYPALTKIADINQAHDTRVLHTALSPDGCNLATASSDENLKFWSIFVKPSSSKSEAGRSGKDSENIGHRSSTIR